MLFTKNLSKRFSFYMLFLLIMSTSCHYYKTLQVEPVNSTTITSTHSLKYNVVVHKNSNKGEFILTEMKIENDSVKGLISFPPEGKKHAPHKKSFLKRKAKAYPPLITMHLYTSIEDIQTGPFEIPVSAVKSIEIHDKNVGASIAATTGLVIGITGVIVVPVLAVACNCPQVESNNSEASQFHGSLFPGAILKSLKRDDYLILDSLLLTNEGDIKLQVSNTLPEIEYIDQLEVLEVEHNGYAYLGTSNENEFVAYNEPTPPILSVDDLSTNVANILKDDNKLTYDFDDIETFDELNELTLKFDRSKFSEDSKLIIRGQQSRWLETVANYIFFNNGKSFNNWVERQDNSSAKKWKDKNIRHGVSLNVYLKVNEKWEYVGSHHDAGTLSMRNLVMDLDLTNVNSPYIEIKLESAYKLWEIDYVGLSNDWSTDLHVNTLDLVSATNQAGEDVTQKINSTDENYLIQNEAGTYVDLHIKGPTYRSTSTMVIHGSGYYHHIRDYEHKRNLKFFVALRKDLGIQDVSRSLYFYKSIYSEPTQSESNTALLNK